MKEWEKCIFKEGDEHCVSSKGLCGYDYNCFITDLEHAEACITSGSWILPCPDCLKIARENNEK